MSSGFITETELADARKKRQEEWEKVRTPDQPLERPEEPYDARPLYERLKEQKIKKEMEFEEAHKLKNLIRGLDDDEVEFLDLVDRTKMKVEKQQQIEEAKELKEFRERVATLQEQSAESKIHADISKPKPKPAIATTRTSQRSLIGSVLRKRKNGELDNGSTPNKVQKDVEAARDSSNSESDTKEQLNFAPKSLDKGALKCIAVLPGIGRYKESSDSEMSSDSDDGVELVGQYDLVGRTIIKTKKKCDDSE